MPVQQATPTRHVVRPWQETRTRATKSMLRAAFDSLRDAVSAAWQGEPNAVEEIRKQRGERSA